MALRSVEDDKELEEEKSSEENNVVGGVSNIPLFSSSEEKLLAYASEQVNTSVNFKKYLGSTQKLCSLGKGNTTCTIIYLTDSDKNVKKFVTDDKQLYTLHIKLMFSQFNIT